jgi:hypothetical protein
VVGTFLDRVCDSLCIDRCFGSTNRSYAYYTALNECRMKEARERMLLHATLNALSDQALDHSVTPEQFEDVLKDIVGVTPVPQSPPHIAPTAINATEVHDEYTITFDTPNLEDDDVLTREILKLALANTKAWIALRHVFLEHKTPAHLDPLGRRIRSILIKLDLGDKHGESQTIYASDAT